MAVTLLAPDVSPGSADSGTAWNAGAVYIGDGVYPVGALCVVLVTNASESGSSDWNWTTLDVASGHRPLKIGWRIRQAAYVTSALTRDSTSDFGFRSHVFGFSGADETNPLDLTAGRYTSAPASSITLPATSTAYTINVPSFSRAAGRPDDLTVVNVGRARIGGAVTSYFTFDTSSGVTGFTKGSTKPVEGHYIGYTSWPGADIGWTGQKWWDPAMQIGFWVSGFTVRAAAAPPAPVTNIPLWQKTRPDGYGAGGARWARAGMNTGQTGLWQRGVL